MGNMKLLLALSTIGALSYGMSSQCMADDNGWSANVAATSNYLWRGLEQTNGSAAISGGIDYASNSGFYAGTWASNADWADEMTYELDFYAGFAGETKNFSYDIGFIYYAYPDSKDDVDFSELYASISMGMFSLSYSVLADAEGVDFADDSYVAIDVALPVHSEIDVTLHVGHGTDDFYAGESFTDYGISLSKSGFTFGLSNTDLDNDDMKVYVSYSIDIDL